MHVWPVVHCAAVHLHAAAFTAVPSVLVQAGGAQVGMVVAANVPCVHNTVDVPDHPLVEQVKVQLLPLTTGDAEQSLVKD